MFVMNRIKRRLRANTKRLNRLYGERESLTAQAAVFADDADDAATRALVSERGDAKREAREATRHAEAMGSSLAKVKAEIAQLEAEQDELLDRLVGNRRT